MKFLLISPPNRGMELGPKQVISVGAHLPPLGLLYLAAILDSNHIPVDILDLEQFVDLNESELENLIKERIIGYRIIGITSLTNTFHLALNIARIIKTNQDSYVIFGGPHVSFMYKEILENDRITENIIDFICVGEAEKSFLDLAKILTTQISENKELNNYENQLESIKGLAFINLKGRIIVTESVDTIDLKDLPLPARYKLSQENYYYTVANIIVNRGCPNQCSFCSRQNLFKKTRIRSIKSILEEIREIQTLQTYTQINFYDNININQKFFKDFCRMFIENKITIPWGCELRVDTISSEEASMLKKAGCVLVATGIESANETVLKRNFKFQDPEEVRAGIINLKEQGIAIQAYFVLGLPGETEQRFNQTIEYIRSLPLDENDEINYFIATPYPGSRLWDEREKFSINIFENDFKKYDCNHIIFDTIELKKEQLNSLYIIAKKLEKEYIETSNQ